MSVSDSMKWLVGRFLDDPRSRVEGMIMTAQPSGGFKALITLEINKTT